MSSLQPDDDIAAAADTTAATCHQSRDSKVLRRLLVSGRAMHSSRSADAVIRVYDVAGNVMETHEHKGEFKEC